MSFVNELKRRNVFKVGAAYLVLAWVVIQVTDTAVPALHLPDWVNSLVFFLGAIGFPFALFFAWAFEITPEGVKKESDVVRDESISEQTGHKLEFAIIGLLIIAVGYFFWEARLETDNSPTANNISNKEATSKIPAQANQALNPASIAVLAFSDLSPQGDQGYFSDGISEEILNVLVKVKGLEVSSRTSSFQFKGREIGIPEIAKKLKVQHILEGSVRKAGETIRITAQLIDTENDKHLWSETYDRPLDAKNVFAIQDEIAQAIVKQLSHFLDVSSASDVQVTPTTKNLSAYDLFLKARPLFQAREKLNQADKYLKQAIELDDDFAKAWAMRAAVQRLKVEYGYSTMSRESAGKLGNQYATKALSINADEALAIATIAKHKMNAIENLSGQYDVESIINDYSRALSIEPRNASALNWRGIIYVMTGYINSALNDFETCIKYEPYYEPCIENYSFLIAHQKGDQFAMQSYLKALDLGLLKIEYMNIFLLARLKDETLFKVVTNNPKFLKGWHRHAELYQAFLHPEKDHQELANDILNFSKAHPQRDRISIGYTLMKLGHYQTRYFTGAEWSQSTKAFRQSTEFKYYIHQSGIYDYWQKKGFPTQCRALRESKLKDDFECD